MSGEIVEVVIHRFMWGPKVQGFKNDKSQEEYVEYAERINNTNN